MHALFNNPGHGVPRELEKLAAGFSKTVPVPRSMLSTVLWMGREDAGERMRLWQDFDAGGMSCSS